MSRFKCSNFYCQSLVSDIDSSHLVHNEREEQIKFYGPTVSGFPAFTCLEFLPNYDPTKTNADKVLISDFGECHINHLLWDEFVRGHRS